MMNAQHLIGYSKVHTPPEELLLCFYLFTTSIPVIFLSKFMAPLCMSSHPRFWLQIPKDI